MSIEPGPDNKLPGYFIQSLRDKIPPHLIDAPRCPQPQLRPNLLFGIVELQRLHLSAFSVARTIRAKLCASRLAPPTSAPSMFGSRINSSAFSGLTLPPY